MMLNPTEFIRLVVDPLRLAVLGAAAVGPLDASRLAEELGVRSKEVLLAMAKLREFGLLDVDGALDRQALRDVAMALPDDIAIDPAVVEGPWSAEEVQVLARFFEGSKLSSIPSSHGKRLLVLERLAQEFEPGVRYNEREVNSLLQMFHPDYAALRRYMVDDGLLTRADGVYWRSGGRTGD